MMTPPEQDEHAIWLDPADKPGMRAAVAGCLLVLLGIVLGGVLVTLAHISN